MAREIRFVLQRPKRSENIGAAARALANTGAGSLWLVSPRAFDEEVAAKVATRGAKHVLDEMRVVETLDEALADCIDVVMTSGREVRGALDPRQTARRLASAAGPVALVFGDEQNGLERLTLRRAYATATIPTAEKSSLNLAQAVLVFAWETHVAFGAAPLPKARTRPLADGRHLAILRERALVALQKAGLKERNNPQRVVDDVLEILHRANATTREVRLLLALIRNLKGWP
ncbi:MAG TPA: RNA methyltransferase [Myxococcales bacterium]|jgi:TrmH family RNA methyltransferase|nr:RNA methyltransferase [Myxococcales bacterium]